MQRVVRIARDLHGQHFAKQRQERLRVGSGLAGQIADKAILPSCFVSSFEDRILEERSRFVGGTLRAPGAAARQIVRLYFICHVGGAFRRGRERQIGYCGLKSETRHSEPGGSNQCGRAICGRSGRWWSAWITRASATMAGVGSVVALSTYMPLFASNVKLS